MLSPRKPIISLMRLFSVGVRMRTSVSLGPCRQGYAESRHAELEDFSKVCLPQTKHKGKALAGIWAARALSRGNPKALALGWRASRVTGPTIPNADRNANRVNPGDVSIL